MKSFMESILEKRGKLVVMCQGNSEYVVPHSDDPNEGGFIHRDDFDDKFVTILGNRYMHIVAFPNGNMNVALPEHDQMLLVDSLARVEFVEATTERWEELKNVYQSYLKIKNMTPEEKEEAARKANAVKNLLLPPTAGKRN